MYDIKYRDLTGPPPQTRPRPRPGADQHRQSVFSPDANFHGSVARSAQREFFILNLSSFLSLAFPLCPLFSLSLSELR